MKYGRSFITVCLAIILVGCQSLVQSSASNKVIEVQEVAEVTDEESTNIEEPVATEKQAVQLVLAYLEEKKEYIPAYVEVDDETDEAYIIHTYDIVIDPITKARQESTIGWYIVNKKTDEVTKQS